MASLIPEAQGLARIVFGLLLRSPRVGAGIRLSTCIGRLSPVLLARRLEDPHAAGWNPRHAGAVHSPGLLDHLDAVPRVLARRTSAGQPAVGPDLVRRAWAFRSDPPDGVLPRVPRGLRTRGVESRSVETSQSRQPAGSEMGGVSLGALRIVAAFLFIHHGLGKVLGPNPADPLSLRGLAAVLELAGGPMLLAGLFTRPLAFLLSGQMAVAYFLSHAPNGFWGSFAGSNQQAAVLNCFLFLVFWTAGPGAWSLDGVRRRRSAATVGVLGAARRTQ